MGRGGVELLAAAAAGAGWAALWVTSSLVWGRAEQFLPGQLHCCDPSPSPATHFQGMWDVAELYPSNLSRCSRCQGILGVIFSRTLKSEGEDHMRSVKNVPVAQRISVPAEICQMTSTTESHVCSVHESLRGYLEADFFYHKTDSIKTLQIPK